MLTWHRVKNGSEMIYTARMDGATYQMVKRDKTVLLEVSHKNYHRSFLHYTVKWAKAKAEDIALNQYKYNIFGNNY